jgi:hypothetical protein
MFTVFGNDSLLALFLSEGGSAGLSLTKGTFKILLERPQKSIATEEITFAYRRQLKTKHNVPANRRWM